MGGFQGILAEYQGFLGAAYLWVKAAHVTFAIFWIAGLFIVPRYYIHHQATTPGSAEDRAWIEREDKARTIILNPAMLIVWVLGLMLAVHLNLFATPWFLAKLALVLLLTGYQGWIGAYGRKLANGHRELDDKKLRLMNEVPGILTALIVVLVIVRPF
jgi:putative membrane protein